jgi:hypothetical protein
MALKSFSGTANIAGSVATGDEALINDVSAGTNAKVPANHLSSVRKVTSIPQGTYNLTAAEAGVCLVNNSSTMTINLPAAASCTGLEFTFKKIHSSASAITIDGNASETIDGAATHTAMDAQYDTITIVCDGSNWHIVHRVIA